MKGAGPGKGVWGQDDDESFSGISGRGGPVVYGAPIEVGQRGYAAGPGQFGYEAPGHGVGNDPRTPGRYNEFGIWVSPRWWPEQETSSGWQQATGAGSASACRTTQGVWTSPASSSYGGSAYAPSACGSTASVRPRAATQQPEYFKGKDKGKAKANLRAKRRTMRSSGSTWRGPRVRASLLERASPPRRPGSASPRHSRARRKVQHTAPGRPERGARKARGARARPTSRTRTSTTSSGCSSCSSSWSA